MVEPDPVEVASSPERTKSAISDAFRREGWVTEKTVGDEVYARSAIESIPVHVRVTTSETMIEVEWLEDAAPTGLAREQVSRHRRRVRRSLRDLQERIEYLIESADLTAE